MYRPDLAWIHQTGFSEFAESAAPGVLELLARAGITRGTVVEAGCGTGVLARELTEAGYRVFAFDVSPAMIGLARVTAPLATFEVAALDEVVLPRCAAILATGEVLNYAGTEAMTAFVEEAAAALLPGGALIFDLAELRDRSDREEVRVGGEDWSVIIVEDRSERRLTRRVLTFRQVEEETRRDDEVHELELFDRDDVKRLLREAGFSLAIRRSYGTYRMPRGHAVYVARRR